MIAITSNTQKYLVYLQIPHPDKSYRSRNEPETALRQNKTMTEDDWFNESLVTLFNELQRQSLDMMQDRNHRHENDNISYIIYSYIMIKT